MWTACGGKTKPIKNIFFINLTSKRMSSVLFYISLFTKQILSGWWDAEEIIQHVEEWCSAFIDLFKCLKKKELKEEMLFTHSWPPLTAQHTFLNSTPTYFLKNNILSCSNGFVSTVLLIATWITWTAEKVGGQALSMALFLYTCAFFMSYLLSIYLPEITSHLTEWKTIKFHKQ